MGGRGQFRICGDNGWGSLGGYMNAKIQKLDQQFEAKKNGQQISSLFDKVSIYVTGYTIPSSDDLKKLMVEHGGKFHLYYSMSNTTYVIATNLPKSKLKRFRSNQKVIRPEWITDSIKESKLLPIHSYIVAAAGLGKGQKKLSGFCAESATTTVDESGISFIATSSAQQTESNELHDRVNDASLPQPEIQQQGDASKPNSKIPATTSSNFLSDFYSHSRLHFLSTWKTELADYVRSLSHSGVELSGRQELLQFTTTSQAPHPSSTAKYVMHVDMDCFFVSVGLMKRPHLVGLPVAVTHHSSSTSATTRKRPGTDVNYEINYYRKKSRLKGNNDASDDVDGGDDDDEDIPSAQLPPEERKEDDVVPSFSEIASCNYEARSRGLKNGMFYGKAKELCPELVAIPYDFDAYREASRKLYSILTSYTRDFEAVSCDEALLDVTDLVAETGIEPMTIAGYIRSKIKEATGCDASAGVGPNIAIARMATKRAKPNGQFEVTLEQVRSFIRDKSVKDLPGVGYATANRLTELGAPTCGDLQNISLDTLRREFGVKTGRKLFDLCRGLDKREVCQSKERKSVSADVNYGIRLATREETSTFLSNLAEEVSKRLTKAHVTGKKITLKVMVRRADAPVESTKFGGHGVCQTLTRSKTLDSSTADCDVIAREGSSLMTSLKVNPPDLRGVGIQMTNLTSAQKEEPETSLDRFIGSRSTNELSSVEERSIDSNSVISSRTSAEVVADTSSKTPSTMKCENKTYEKSFLDALPDDIRREVELNINAQKMALRCPNASVSASGNVESATSFPNRSNSSVTSGACQTSKSTLRSGKKGRGRPKGATGAKHSNRSKRGTKDCGSNPGSATVGRRITEMFKVVGRTRADGEAASQSSKSDASESAKVMPEIDVDELVDRDDDSPPSASPPSLGGATTTEEARESIRQWFAEYSNRPPLESDVEEVATFLKRLTVESHDLECVDLVLRTFRRTVLSSLPADREAMLSWFDAYEYVTDRVQEVVRQMYDGMSLQILPINQ